jgi:Ca2+-binding RTX toxin-like protein
MTGSAIADQGVRGLRYARRGVLLTTVVALAAFAGTASAATVSKSAPTLTYQAVAGETNNTVVTKPSADTYRFTETPGPLTAGTGCTQTAANIVTCVQHEPIVVANLLDQNDTFSLAGVNIDAGAATATLNGGTGADTLTGSTKNDTLNGGDDADTLDGDNGNDTLNGDNGNDTMDGGNNNDALNGGSDGGMDRMTGGSGNDVFDGGPGIDRAIYTSGNLNITIDNTANDTGDGTDNVMDTVESITGGSGNDTITGSCFSNTLAGQAGNDTLNGDPTTCGSYGGDFMGGGAGNDIMRGSLTPTATDGVDRVTYTSNTASQATSGPLAGVANDTDGLGSTTDNVGRDIEYLYGGPEVDVFNACGTPVSGTGCSGGNSALQGVSFWTGANNDTLYGSNFNDLFDGQAGNDLQDCKGDTGDMYKVDGADSPAPVNCETAF